MNSVFLDMPENFEKDLEEAFTLLKGKKLLLAVSGGIDSMVMVHVFLNNGFDISLAHCNFQLRDDESFKDQKFIERFAKENQLQVFITRFDTQTFANDYHLSTQMAARELRYNWFNELIVAHGFDYVLTAHHADDNLETFLINLSRGTGIDGLAGIPKQNGKIFRPMLGITRQQIEAYASLHNIQWREDSSNASDGYLRNKIRHHVVPNWKESSPNLLATFSKTQHYLQQTQSMAEDAAILIYRQIAQQAGDEIHFDLDKLQKLPNYRAYLYHWLREFGFTAWDDIYDLTDGETGKQVLASKYRLFKHRRFLILNPIKPSTASGTFTIEAGQQEVNFPIKLMISQTGSVSIVSNNVIFVDAQKIRFPMVLRKWRQGDVFWPFGMDGQSKKVSKFFKDEQFSLTDKEKTWLLCSGDDIVWIVGHRADERFKIQPTTNQILKITLTQ